MTWLLHWYDHVNPITIFILMCFQLWFTIHMSLCCSFLRSCSLERTFHLPSPPPAALRSSACPVSFHPSSLNSEHYILRCFNETNEIKLKRCYFTPRGARTLRSPHSHTTAIMYSYLLCSQIHNLSMHNRINEALEMESERNNKAMNLWQKWWGKWGGAGGWRC